MTDIRTALTSLLAEVDRDNMDLAGVRIAVREAREALLESGPLYLVADGEYEDYTPQCVCYTEADADYIASRMADGSVVELQVADKSAKRLTIYTMSCIINVISGEVVSETTWSLEVWPFDDDTDGVKHPSSWSWRFDLFLSGNTQRMPPSTGLLRVGGTDRQAVLAQYASIKLAMCESQAWRKRPHMSGSYGDQSVADYRKEVDDSDRMMGHQA